jgi:hypothetical protein
MDLTQKIGYGILTLFVFAGLAISYLDVDYFENTYAVEDGLVEWTTTILLLMCSIYLFSKVIALRKVRPFFWLVCTSLLGILFFFGAGEEISWGQRLLGIESGDFFSEHNAQKETNLHNLVVGETKLNRLIFGRILTVVLVIYLIVIPFFHRKYEWLRKLVKFFAVPLPQVHHSLAFIVVTILVTLMPSSKKWEIYELAFGLIFFLILISPKNNEIYSKQE